MLEELIVVDQSCAPLLLGRMSGATAEEFERTATASSPTIELLSEAATSRFQNAAETYRTAATSSDAVCLSAANAASARPPTPEPEPAGEEADVYGALGSGGHMQTPDDRSGE